MTPEFFLFPGLLEIVLTTAMFVIIITAAIVNHAPDNEVLVSRTL